MLVSSFCCCFSVFALFGFVCVVFLVLVFFFRNICTYFTDSIPEQVMTEISGP